MTDRKAALTKEEFRAIRLALGETEIQFARSLGYIGKDSNNHRLIRRIEAGSKPITTETAIRALDLKGRIR